MAITLAQEVTKERKRDDDLEQRSAQKAQELAERSENEVSGLVDRQVDVVDNPEGIGTAENDESVDRQKRGEPDLGARG